MNIRKTKLGWFVGLLSVVLLVVCMVGIGNYNRKVRLTQEQGRWVQVMVLEKRPKRAGRPYAVVVARNEEWFTIHTRSGNFFRRCRVGEFIEVKFLPEDHFYAVADEPTTFGVVLIVAMGGVCVLLVVTLIRAYKPIFKAA